LPVLASRHFRVLCCPPTLGPVKHTARSKGPGAGHEPRKGGRGLVTGPVQGARVPLALPRILRDENNVSGSGFHLYDVHVARWLTVASVLVTVSLMGVGLSACSVPGGPAAAGLPAGRATRGGAYDGHGRRVSPGRGVSRTARSGGAIRRRPKAAKGAGPGRVLPITGPVLEVGDSLGIDLGWGLQTELAGSGHELLGEAVGDTGLAETWYYNWPAHLATYLAEFHPGLLIVFLGANDVENLYVGGVYDPFGSRGWVAAYGARVATMMEEATAAKARVLWVGMPPMGDPSFSSDMATLNAVYQAQVAHHGPDVAYFASWTVLGTAQGQYLQGPPGPDGQDNPWRDPDGVHITSQGADVLAAAVVAHLRTKGWLQKTKPPARGH
jgi:uncharacterized protein